MPRAKASSRGSALLLRGRRSALVRRTTLPVELAGVELVVLRAVQLPQFDAAQPASLQGPADQGVVRALGRAQQQGARLQAAQEVPVPGLRGVDGEQVQLALHDEPQDERALQGQAAQARAVDGRAQGAQGRDDRVRGPARPALGGGDGDGVVGVRHLSAP